jgi:hypothetical protein
VSFLSPLSFLQKVLSRNIFACEVFLRMVWNALGPMPYTVSWGRIDFIVYMMQGADFKYIVIHDLKF